MFGSFNFGFGSGSGQHFTHYSPEEIMKQFLGCTGHHFRRHVGLGFTETMETFAYERIFLFKAKLY